MIRKILGTETSQTPRAFTYSKNLVYARFFGSEMFNTKI